MLNFELYVLKYFLQKVIPTWDACHWVQASIYAWKKWNKESYLFLNNFAFAKQDIKIQDIPSTMSFPIMATILSSSQERLSWQLPLPVARLAEAILAACSKNYYLLLINYNFLLFIAITYFEFIRYSIFGNVDTGTVLIIETFFFTVLNKHSFFLRISMGVLLTGPTFDRASAISS